MRLWLKKIREDACTTRQALAAKVDVSDQYIYYLETGARSPHVETAKKIAAVLGFDWQRFFEDGEAGGWGEADA